MVRSTWQSVEEATLSTLEKYEIPASERSEVRECLSSAEGLYLEDVTTACGRPDARISSEQLGKVRKARASACVDSVPLTPGNVCPGWIAWSPEKRAEKAHEIWSSAVNSLTPILDQFKVGESQRAALYKCLAAEEEPFAEETTAACSAAGARVDLDRVGQMAGARAGGCVERAL